MEFLKRLGARLLTYAVVIAVVAVIAFVVGKWEDYRRDKHKAEVAAATTEFSPFLSADPPPADATEESGGRYRKGRLLVIDAKDKKIDELFYELPASLRASRSNEVGTLVWLRWDAQTVGRYSGGGLAVKTDCDVLVYDVARKALVAREQIVGDTPPGTITTKKGGYASWDQPPKDKIVNFLRGLPER